jgi:hypothetical protein
MPISSSFPETDKKYSEKQIITEIYSRNLAHSEQIHSARDIYPTIFVVVDLIRFM